MSLLRLVLAASIACLSTLPARAQCPALDPSFHQSGFNNHVVRSAVFDDGTGPAIYAVGQFTEASGAACPSIARFDGTQWRALPGTSVPLLSIYSIQVWDDGTGPALYVGGYPDPQGGIAAIYKWNGSAWTALPGGPNRGVEVLQEFGGFLYAGGEFDTVNGQPQPGIARWNGSSWVPMAGVLGSASPYEFGVFALRVFDDGNGPALFAGGWFDTAGGLASPGIARWDGANWSAVASMPLDYINSLEICDVGNGPELIAAGSYQTSGGTSTSRSRVSRLHQGSWSILGTFFYGAITDLAVYDDGSGHGASLYVCGAISYASDSNVNAVARWTGSAWAGLGQYIGVTVQDLLAEDPYGGGHLFAFGSFEQAGNALARGAAKWDGTSWSALDVNTGIVGHYVTTMLPFDDDHGHALYVGGNFMIAGNVDARGIARWDGSTWSALQTGPDGDVRSLCLYDDGSGSQIYVGGYFFTINGNLRRIGRWNGSQWSELPGGFPFWTSYDPSTGQTYEFSTSAMVTYDDGSGPALYVGGVLTWGSNHGIARYKSGTWSQVGEGLSLQVNALVVHDDGSGPALYAGGRISSSGGTALSNIAKWNGSQWVDVGGGVQAPSFDGAVDSLLSYDDGTGPALYVGGYFTSAGGLPVSNVARFKNGAWEALGSGTAGVVLALTLHDDGTGAGPALYAGSSLTSPGGTTVSGLIKWDGSTWSLVGSGVTNLPGVGAAVRALASWNKGTGRDLYLGGSFLTVGAQPSPNFARWIGCGETGRLYCFGDGSGAACPCGNNSTPGDRAGCTHSFGSGGTLRAVGESSLSGDSLVLRGADMPSSAVLYFQGIGSVAGGAGVAFGDGLRCVSGPFVRLGTKVNVNGASSFPSVNDAGVSVRGAIHSPGSRTYQVRYRNSASFCTSDTFNTTNAVELLWTP